MWAESACAKALGLRAALRSSRQDRLLGAWGMRSAAEGALQPGGGDLVDHNKECGFTWGHGAIDRRAFCLFVCVQSQYCILNQKYFF